MLQGLGEEMVKESTKSLMHQGLGKLGDLIFGKKKDAEVHRPTGNPGDAVHVLVDNQPGVLGAPVSAGNFQNLAGLVGAGSSGLAGLLKGLFSAGGSGASSGLTEAVSSSITFMAGGGDANRAAPTWWASMSRSSSAPAQQARSRRPARSVDHPPPPSTISMPAARTLARPIGSRGRWRPPINRQWPPRYGPTRSGPGACPRGRKHKRNA